MTLLKKRIDSLEEKFKANEKYKGCELEIEPGVEDEPTTYYCRYPDGHRELIIDNNVIDELADIPGDVSVEIVD